MDTKTELLKMVADEIIKIAPSEENIPYLTAQESQRLRAGSLDFPIEQLCRTLDALRYTIEVNGRKIHYLKIEGVDYYGNSFPITLSKEAEDALKSALEKEYGATNLDS